MQWYGLQAMAIHVLLLALGYSISYFHDIQNSKSWYAKHTTPTTKLRAKILTPPKETERTYKATAEIIAVYEGDVQTQTIGEVLLYFNKSENLPKLAVQDEILIVNKLKPLEVNGNPGEFDYRAYCQNKGIYHQAFLNKPEWQKLHQSPSSFQNPFSHWHTSVKAIISKYIPNPEAKGIALALITGYRGAIDKEIYTKYTKTGLVHLLAISGLHMGILYGSMFWILGFIPFFKKRKQLLIVIALSFMWLFALITTFPPSVQRASIMFTFLGIGQLVNRKTSSYNFLFASAFGLLLFQPHLLFEVGFQLSYSAVLGILLFYKPLRAWYAPKYISTKFLWEIMCLSLSAQIFTFPIALYYFHQLPLLFLFTNLIAIPAVMLAIYGEILIIALSFIPPVASLLGKVVSMIITTLNQLIEYTASIKFVSIQNIYINLWQCLLLLLLMLALTAWVVAKRRAFVPVMLFFFMVFIIISVNRKYVTLTQEKLIVYNSQHPYLEYINGSKTYSPDSIPHAKMNNFRQYTLKPSHLELGVKDLFQEKPNWQYGKQYDLICQSNKKILRIKKSAKLKILNKVEVDHLILSDKWVKDLRPILKNISAKEIIIDGNIPLWKIEELKSQLQEVDLPTHYVAIQGAKIIQL